MQVTVSIIVTGKVQGVFYRQSAKEKATALGITGTVQNMANGEVKIIATGNLIQLKALTDWCETGPPKAVVTAVHVEEIPLKTYSDFKIVRF